MTGTFFLCKRDKERKQDNSASCEAAEEDEAKTSVPGLQPVHGHREAGAATAAGLKSPSKSL